MRQSARSVIRAKMMRRHAEQRHMPQPSSHSNDRKLTPPPPAPLVALAAHARGCARKQAMTQLSEAACSGQLLRSVVRQFWTEPTESAKNRRATPSGRTSTSSRPLRKSVTVNGAEPKKASTGGKKASTRKIRRAAPWSTVLKSAVSRLEVDPKRGVKTVCEERKSLHEDHPQTSGTLSYALSRSAT